jgi:hypothetical protein
MPPVTPKVKIKIKTRFVDEQGGRLFAPGIWDVHPSISMRLVANGKATLVGPAPAAKAPGEKALTKAPATNPRIPPAKEPDEVVPTPLPEDFPSRDVLAAAGLDTVEQLQAPDIKETLSGVDGLTPADITKIGLAISKV